MATLSRRSRRSFSEERRRLTRERLREEGRELFSRFGVRKTTIRQLSGAAGIASGSFYLYFDSKESLYLDVLAAEIAVLKAKNDRECAPMVAKPDQMIGAYLLSAISQIRESRILGLMLDSEERQSLLVAFRGDDRAREAFRKLSEPLSQTIDEWRQKKLLADMRPEVVRGVVRSLFLLSMHEREIGKAVLSDVMKALVGMVAGGLAAPRRSARR